MKVLIVDDVDYIRKSICKVLEDNGYTCDTCNSGRTAIAKLEENSYDLIITDIVMPDLDGFEFLDFIREQDPPKCDIPILAMSGGSNTIDSESALQSVKRKSNGIIQKPFDKDSLMQAIESIIGA